MNKVVKYLFAIIFALLLISVPSKVYAAAGNVQTLEIKVDKNGTINFKGTTVGSTNNMNLLVKVFNKDSLEFFDQIVVDGNGFTFKATPINKIPNGTTLKISIVGDLTYSGTFYYSTEYSTFVEEVEQESINLLEKYAVYYDDTISTKLKFDVSTSFNGKVLFVYLKGTNFRADDKNWLEKDAVTWETFLKTITTKGYEVSKGNTVYVYIYDKNGKLLQSFPEKAEDALETPSDKDDDTQKPGDGNNNDKPSTGEEENKPTDTSIITEEILDKLLQGNTSYSASSYKYVYDFSLIKATANLIKVKAVGNFSKKDDCWVYVKNNKLEAFFDTCALKIKNQYNVDIDFVVYDKDGNVLTSYNYYTYEKEPEVPDYNDSESSSSSSSESSSSTQQPEVNEDYEPEEDVLERVPDEYELDPEYQFVPWNDKRATGLVLALHLATYGSNSAMIVPSYVDEESVSGSYVYNITVDDVAVSTALSTLRHDSQKIVYVKKQTDSNNITLELTANAVSKLKDAKALFIFDSDYYKVELNFAKFTGSGNVIINSADASISSDDYAKPLILTIKANGKDAAYSFSENIKCLIHYESEKTKKINDLRSINVYNSKGVLFNSTATTLEKGFIFMYTGADTYYAKNNQYEFTDSKKVWEDSMAKRYAELVVSKGIIKAKNNEAFNPEGSVTRGEFIYMLACKMGAFSNTQHFANIDSSHKYYTAINGIYELGILPSTFRKNLEADKEITREEMIYMIVRCYEVNNNNATVTSASLLYRDKAEISVWAKTKIGVASKLGIIDDDGYLYPSDGGNREFAATLFYNLLVAEGIF